MVQKGLHDELYHLENDDCMSAYATNFQSEYGSVLLLTDDFHPNDTDFDFLSSQGPSTTYKGDNPYAWMCWDHTVYASEMQTLCRDQLPEIRAHADHWIVGGYRVKYCLAERVPGKCKLEYSLPLAIIVIVFNIVKAIVICAVALTMNEQPILTTGDAVASFLKSPETRDRDHCLMSKTLAKNPTSRPLPYEAKPQRWATAVSILRWTICIIWYVRTYTPQTKPPTNKNTQYQLHHRHRNLHWPPLFRAQPNQQQRQDLVWSRYHKHRNPHQRKRLAPVPNH